MDDIRWYGSLQRDYWTYSTSVVSCVFAALALVVVNTGLINRAFSNEEGAMLRSVLRGHASYISSVAFSPDSQILASAGPNIKLWNPLTGEEMATLKTDNASSNFIRYSSDGSSIISSRGDGDVIVWDVGTGEHSLLFRNGGGATNAAISHEVATLATIMNGKNIGIWDFSLRKQLKTIDGGGIDTTAYQCPGAIQFSPNMKTLATAHKDGKIRLWAVTDGRLVKTINAQKPHYAVTSVAFSPDGKSLAAGAGGNSQGYYTSACKVTLWNVKSGDQLTSFTGNENGVADVAISPDGSIIASGGHDSTVRLWDIATGKSIATLRGHRHAVMSIAISPNGRFVASGSGDRTVRLWELASIKGKP